MLTVDEVEKLYKEEFGSVPELGFISGSEQIDIMLDAIGSGSPISQDNLPPTGDQVLY
jgi:hypothetical protein